MSLVTYTSPFSAVNPKVWQVQDVLHARTALFLQILCLFVWRREVIANPRIKIVTLKTRIFWFFKREHVIRFKDISHLDYKYSSMATSWDWFGNTHDNLESFTIALVLHDRKMVSLMKFRGEGSVQTGLMGVFMGDSIIDTQGNQEKQSLYYLEALRDATGKSLSNDRTFFKRDESRTNY